MSIILQLNREFDPIKRRVRAAYVAVGMITKEKFDYFMRSLVDCPEISIVTGIHMPTPPDILENLQQLTAANRITSGVFAENFFHPKLYLFELNDGWVAFVGSGNFTNGGWSRNEELFLKVTDTAVCQSLKEQHAGWMLKSVPINENLIARYRQTFQDNISRRKEEKQSIDKLIAAVKGRFDIDNVDFTGQFFSKEVHMTFAPGKTHLDTPDVLHERTRVRNKLYELNELLERKIPPSWNIHPHYMREHLAAHIRTEGHHEENVRALWLAYGRSEKSLKKYGDIGTTPLNFMRMQVIIGYDYIGIWLMPGKSMGGQIDRENLQRRIREQGYRERFYENFMALGNDYWIEIAAEEKYPRDFNSPEQLQAFIAKDNWRKYYFTIGRNYVPGSPEMKTERIIETIFRDYGKFLPLYNLILDTSMEAIPG